MNFLAHAYLSFGEGAILAGNMISDFVKGKKKFDYSEGIQKGIALHRMIDTFTDEHPATAEAKAFFRKDYRLYAGAFVDVVYDHFLANDRSIFTSEEALYEFTQGTYALLDNFKESFPPVFSYMFGYMKKDNWLYNYKTKEGVRKSFGGLVRRAEFMDDASMAADILDKNYTELQNCYNRFFSDVHAFAKQTLMQLNAG
ncbi:MAG: DUF479 domain-containing protein [Chitinophagaceae bacterium]|nr:DUF479 domain-containing protein [Chitinophagaceae bacterium]